MCWITVHLLGSRLDRKALVAPLFTSAMAATSHEKVTLTLAPQLLTLSAVFLLACISPGPDFTAVTSNALADRLRGLGVAVGVAVACTIWATLAMFGLGLLLTKIAWLHEAVRLGGAAYLHYLGVKMLLGARHPPAGMQVEATRNA